MKYRREIDGLRTIAVLPVIIFHAGFEAFSGGYVGVDVFFVISGYLITSILIAELEQGRFSIARFYERRARRILPALFFVMFSCLPFAWMWMLPSQMNSFSQSVISVIFFVSNILFWRESGYFAADAELKPLLHTWSLAVEEQYYLIFPVFLLLTWRFGRNRIFWSIVLISAVSLLASEWGWRYRATANFYLAPTRVWELLFGSLTAFYLQHREQPSSNPMSILGMFLIVFSIFYFDETTPFPSIFALAPVLGAVLVIVFAEKRTVVGKILSTAPFVGIGLISYSAYLWHQPLFAFARIRSLDVPSEELMAFLAVMSLFLAWVTWRYVETPFRLQSAQLIKLRHSVFAISGLIGGFFVAISLSWLLLMGNTIGTIGNESRESNDEACNYDAGNCFNLPGADLSVALWGDSYADAFSTSLGHILNKNGVSLTLYIRHSCPSLLGVLRNEDARRGQGDGARCKSFTKAAFESIASGNFDIVILTSSYEWYATGVNIDGQTILLKDDNLNTYDGESTVDASLGETALALEKVGSKVLIVTPHPRVKDFDKKIRDLYFQRIEDLYAEYASAAHTRQNLLTALTRRKVAWTEENGLEWYCNDGICPVINSDNRSLLYDGSHISTTLAPKVAENLYKAISEIQ